MSGRSVVEAWEDALKKRFGKNLGMRILLPNTEGPTYEPIQKSWGIFGAELTARKDRVRAAHDAFERIWKGTEEARRESTPAGDKPSTLELYSTDKCPFYSFYLFDDKVCVAPYPFIRPEEPNIPVYIFFAGSREYERIKKEAQTLFEYARQSKV
jgi:hypothetical protein